MAVGLLLALAPVLAAAQDAGRSVAGVTLPERIEVEARTLLLNGAALRKVALIKIYVAGLYLPGRTTEADAILASDEPRSLVMHFLRDVPAKRLCEGWDSSLEENTPDPSPALQEQFRTLCSWMENAREGERLAFMYVPGHGTSVQANGRIRGPLAGKEFADALFRTWLGPKSLPGEDFKQHLLGLR
jgi:hypothetical protein